MPGYEERNYDTAVVNSFLKDSSEAIAEYSQIIQWAVSKSDHYKQRAIDEFLDAEEADRIRGEKNERKSRVGNQGLHPDSPQMIDYLRNKANELELLRTVPADLVPYYRDRVNEYFNTLDDEQ